MPKYMLLLYADESAPVAPGLYERMFAYREALSKAGAFVDSAPMQKSSAARTLRLRDGEMQVHDGPYADTRERFGGYFVIDVADMDEALGWAARCPSADTGPIEIRPFLAGF